MEWDDLVKRVDQPEPTNDLSWDDLVQRTQVGDHAAELAKHRWSRLKQAEATDTHPLITGENLPYQGKAGPLLGDLSRPTVGGGLPTPDKPLPTMPTIAPVAPGEAPAGERLLRNTAIGAANLPSNTVNFFTGLVNSPQEAVAGLVEQGKAMGKAGLWAAAKSVNPQLGPIAEAAGFGPDEFKEMFLADPVGTGALVLGGVEGMRRGLKGLGETPGKAPAVEAPVEGAPNYPGGYLDPNWAKSPEGQAYLAEHPETAALWEKMAAKKAAAEAPTERRATPTAEPREDFESLVAKAEAANPGPERKAAYKEAHRAVFGYLQEQMDKAGATDPTMIVTGSERLKGVLDRMEKLEGNLVPEDQKPLAKEVLHGVSKADGSPVIPAELTDAELTSAIKFSQDLISRREADKPGGFALGGDYPEANLAKLQKELARRAKTEPGHKAKVEAQANIATVPPEPPAVSNGLASTPETPELVGERGIVDKVIESFAAEQKANLTALDHVASWYRNLFKDFSERPFIRSMFGTLPQFFKMAGKVPDMYAAFAAKLGAVDDAGVAHASLIKNGLDKIIPQNDVDYGRLGAYFLDQRRQGLLANPANTTVNVPALSTIHNARIAADPRFKAALDLYDQRIAPELDNWKKDAGIEVDTTTPDNRYLPLKTVAPGRTPPPGTWVIDDQGHLFQWTKEHTKSLGGTRTFGPFRKQRAAAARQATGRGEMWIADPGYLTKLALNDRIPKARHNQLIDVTKKYEVTDKADLKKGSTNFQGKDVPISYVEVRPQRFIIEDGEQPVTVGGSIPVPKPIADAYKFALNPPPDYFIPGVAAVNNLSTSLALASPAEAAVHSVNVNAGVFRQPGVGNTPLGKILAKDPTSLGRWATIMADIADQSGPLLEKDVRRLSTYGGVRASQFAGEESGLQRLPGLKQMKEAVFDYPGNKKGIRGFETRNRVAILRLLDKLEPKMGDAQKVAIINNELGTYVKAMQPTLVRALRQIPVFGDPFAGAGVALTKGALKSLVGKSGATYRPLYAAETAAAVWISAVTLPIILNKLINGKYPWELAKQGVKAGDVLIYQDDKKTVTIPFRLLAPVASRGLGVLGGRDMTTKIMRGEATPDVLAQEALRGAMNTATHRVSPLGRLTTLAATGKAPHWTPRGELMQVAEKNPQHQARENLKSALVEATPVVGGEQITAFEDGRYQPDTPGGRAVQRMLSSIGMAPTIGPPLETMGKINTASQFSRFKEAAQQLASRVQTLSAKEQDAAIKEWADANVPPEIQQYFNRVVRKTLAYRNMHRP